MYLQVRLRYAKIVKIVLDANDLSNVGQMLSDFAKVRQMLTKID